MICIPRILHYVWLGDKPPHPTLLEWQQRWATLHPGWQVKTWRQVDGLPAHLLACGDELVECRCPTYLDACPTPAKKSDVWRYDILEQHGGVYLDFDFEPIKNIEPLLDDTSAFAGLCKTFYNWQSPKPTPSLEVACSIMGAVPHHPWLRELVKNTPAQDLKKPISLAFPYLTEITGHHPEVRLLDPLVFYPLTWDQCTLEDHRSLKKAVMPESSYAIHRWSSTWISGYDLSGYDPQDPI